MNAPHRRIALITGGAGGLGAATARRLAYDGLYVAVADRDEDAARRLAAELPGSGHIGIGMDVASEASVSAAFEAVESTLGPVAVLAAFAGINKRAEQTERTSIAMMSLQDWDVVQAINARGTFLAVREMAQRRPVRPVEHGRIITIASVAAQLGGYQSTAAYIASKGAILSFTKAAAREFAPLGITVNVIAPGAIETPLLREAMQLAAAGDGQHKLPSTSVPLGRFGLPEEIAAAASYLASPDAAYVTGATIDVNGGLRMQ
jgi:3-oxoacyl-[acyl-carrier protein] reductase